MKLFAVVALTALSAAGADSREFTRPSWQNLTPEARQLLSDWSRAGAEWKSASPRPLFLVRGQFFYGNESAGYIHRWYERPLFQDTSLAKHNERGHMLNPQSWKLTVDVAHMMKLDGFGFFPLNPGCLDLIPRSVMPGAEMTMLPQLCGPRKDGSIEKMAEFAEKLRAMPNALRIGGKTVIIGYPELSWQKASVLAEWKRLREMLVEKYGPGAFAVMPCIRLFDGRDADARQTTAKALAKTRDRLRQILEDFDGLYYTWDEFDWTCTSRLGRPHDEIAVPMIRSLMAEPQFRGKCLGFGFMQGHENTYRRFSEYPSGGLRRLRAAMRSMMAIMPDFVMGEEWDEENENTHFRPTVSNGQTTQRVMRYYHDLVSGVPPTPCPGDDASVPNLILSYRKTLVAGEAVEAQVVNVPDGTRGKWRVGFRWLDENGRPVKAFAERDLSAESCDEVSFDCSSVDLVSVRILRPELTVRGPGGVNRTFVDGFWPMNIEAVRNLDSKWVRQALREIPTGVNGTLRLMRQAKDDSWVVSGSVSGPRRFRSIEVLEDSDTAFMQAPGTNSALSMTHFSITVSFMGVSDFFTCHVPTGTVRLVGAPNAVVSDSNKAYSRRKGMTWRLGFSVPALNFINTCRADIPLDEVATAAFEIDLPNLLPPKQIAVRDISRRGAYSFALPHGGQVSVRGGYSVRTIPEPPLTRESSFAFRIKPINPAAILRLQLIDEDYRIWRGPVVTTCQLSGEKSVFRVYDEISGSAREVTADRSLVYAPRYDFARSNGDLAYPEDGRLDSPCVLGGGIGIVTGVGAGGGNGYQHAVRESRPPFATTPGGGDTAPKIARLDDGTSCLVFTNCNFATLPNHFIPRYAGFVLSMRVWPDDVDGKMGILDSNNLGFRLTVVDGVPVAFLSLGNEMLRKGVNATAGTTVRGPALSPRSWNDVRVVFDQTTAHVEVNGVRGEARPCCGFELNPASTAFGLFLDNRSYFRGRVANLSVSPF